jgi:hypothetical protein
MEIIHVEQGIPEPIKTFETYGCPSLSGFLAFHLFIPFLEDLPDAGFSRDVYNEFLGLLNRPFQRIEKSHKGGTGK